MKEYYINNSIPVTESGCWIWERACNKDGYGHHCILVFGEKKWIDAHRGSYIAFKGYINTGMTIDHLCKVKCCINPDHLDCVTNKENNSRGNSRSALNLRKTHCPQGHPLSGDNLYLYRGKRGCFTCRRKQASQSNLKARNARHQQI